MCLRWEIYGLQPGSLSFSGAKLSSSIIKTSEESFWSQQWALRQTLMQTHILYTDTHSKSCTHLCSCLCSHTYRNTHATTHIYCLSVYLHTLWKDAGQIRLELYLLPRRKFISTASQLQVHSYKTVITPAYDLTQNNTQSQRECSHTEKS